MTIVREKDLDADDLAELGDNVTEAIRIDHEAAIDRSLACHETEPAKHARRTPNARRHP